MSRNIVSRVILGAAIVLCFTGPSQAAPSLPSRRLVLVATPQPADLHRLASAGAVLYARFHTLNGPYALAGATDSAAARLGDAGLVFRILDRDVAGHAYYLVYSAPGASFAPLADGGAVLFDDSRVAVIRSDEAAIERLTRAGADIALVTLDPKPVESTPIAAFAPVAAPDPVVRWMVDQVTQDTVRKYAGDLSGAWATTIRGSPYQIRTRHTNSGTPIQQATYYVGDHLAALGLTVEYHGWGPASAPNVIGQKAGGSRPGDIFMVTAHLDDMPTGDLAPGADDNASGSAAVLIAAGILSQFSWDCTLRFALWTGEEQGLQGSEKYAQRAKNSGENILGVFNLDMIGWNTPGSPPDVDLHADSSRPATVDLANQAASVIDAYDLALIPEVRSDGTGSSDHASFWNYGYTAILGIEDYYPNSHDFDPYYHKTTDTLATLDLEYFTQYVRLAVAETAHMAGCLTTGRLAGAVQASHDASPISGAQIELQDIVGREYSLQTAEGGRYSQAVPPGTYSASVSAYGYEAASQPRIAVAAHGSYTQDFTLSAAQPVIPAVAITASARQPTLTWLHVSPNTSYQVHRSLAPYFSPAAGSLVATIEAAHQPAPGEVLSYDDTSSGFGDATYNHFYRVLGLNAADIDAASTSTGEFDFRLTLPGDI